MIIKIATDNKEVAESEAVGLRPYYAENTGSHPNPEVKLRQASLVLGWGTTLEPEVLQAFCLFIFCLQK